MVAPLCIDLFCGLGGWTEGFLAEGYDVIGFDIEQHVYGEHRYPAQLVIQDVRTLHGSQFKNAAAIVGSPPCQEYSYMAMPWYRAKAKAVAYRERPETQESLTELFRACFRIQREASEAAGRHIPMIVENVKGAQPWVGRAQWHYGSFYLWGDVPALMPTTIRRAKVGSLGWSEFAKTGQKSKGFNTTADQLAHGRADTAGTHFEEAGSKNAGGSWFNVAHNTESGRGQNPDGRKLGDRNAQRRASSKSSARKAASARIAKIPFPLAQHIAHVYRGAA